MKKLAVFVLILSQVTMAAAPARATLPREGDVRFKVTCNYSHTLPDDPIVHPGVPGASHLHDFTGNTGVNAYVDTYAELIAVGSTTCNDPSDLAGYWTPQLRVNGSLVQPDRMTGYYRRGGKEGDISPYPAGLKIVAEEGVTGYKCDQYPYSRDTFNGCRTNLTIVVEFPDCWDGVALDSSNHRDHMEYAEGGDGRNIPNVCPGTHPIKLPELQTFTHYPDAPVGATFSLSSGNEGTLHGDFFNGWLPERMSERVATCLNYRDPTTGEIVGQKCDSGG